MSPSKRVQITLGERAYSELDKLALLAEVDIHTEARLLLTWAIRLACKRWANLTPDDTPDAPPLARQFGWEQPPLPEIAVAPQTIQQAMAEMAEESNTPGHTGPVERIVELPDDEP